MEVKTEARQPQIKLQEKNIGENCEFKNTKLQKLHLRLHNNTTNSSSTTYKQHKKRD